MDTELTPNQTSLANARNALAIAQLLYQHGYHVVHSPGARNTTLVRALEQCSVPVTTVIDERAAGFLALGLARAGGKAALLSTSGSACSHYLPALLEARASCCPVLVLSCDRPARLQQVRAAQTTDQLRIARATVDTCCQIPLLSAVTVECVLEDWQQLQLALQSRTPAWWNMGIDEPFWPSETPVQVPTMPARSATAWNPERAVTYSRKIPRRGLLVCGANLEPASELPALAQCLQEIGTTTGWPIVLDGGCSLQPYFADHPSITHQNKMAQQGLPGIELPDLVVRIGGATTSKAFEQWLAGTRQVSIAPGQVCNPAAGQTDWIDARSMAGLQAVFQSSCTPDPTWASRWHEIQQTIATDSDTTARSLWQWIAEYIEPDTVLHLANSTVIRDFEVHGRSLHTLVCAIHSNRGLNGIDGQIATCVGEAMGHGKPVYCVLGDVTSQHDIGSLALVQQSPVPVHLVLLNNKGGQIFRQLPGLQAYEQFIARFATPPQWKFAQAAAATGLQYRAVQHHELDRPPTALHHQEHSSVTEVFLP